MQFSFIWNGERDRVIGWRYLWAKHVTGFVPSCHCARCLKGEYTRAVTPDMTPNRLVTLDRPPGSVMYFCGVSKPYDWAKNLHLAVRVTGEPGDMASVKTYTGDELTVSGAIAIPFTDAAARALYPHRGPEFLTCRNYQFGASFFSAAGADARA